jgi:hypothetical protein
MALFLQLDSEDAAAVHHKVTTFADTPATATDSGFRTARTACGGSFDVAPHRVNESETEPEIGRCPDCFGATETKE